MEFGSFKPKLKLTLTFSNTHTFDGLKHFLQEHLSEI